MPKFDTRWTTYPHIVANVVAQRISDRKPIVRGSGHSPLTESLRASWLTVDADERAKYVESLYVAAARTESDGYVYTDNTTWLVIHDPESFVQMAHEMVDLHHHTWGVCGFCTECGLDCATLRIDQWPTPSSVSRCPTCGSDSCDGCGASRGL